MDWTDIEAKLVERAEDVCRHLFPNGKREGAEFVVGSLAGEAGNSLKVNLTGKVGVWRDFAGDKGGKSLMSLWLQAKNLPKFGAAVVDAKKYLGIADDFQKRVQAYPAPGRATDLTRQDGHAPDDSAWKNVTETWAKCQPLTEGGPVYRYLTETRKLDPLAIEAFGVREFISHGKWAMVFPYFHTPTEEKPIVVRPGGAAAHAQMPEFAGEADFGAIGGAAPCGNRRMAGHAFLRRGRRREAQIEIALFGGEFAEGAHGHGVLGRGLHAASACAHCT